MEIIGGHNHLIKEQTYPFIELLCEPKSNLEKEGTFKGRLNRTICLDAGIAIALGQKMDGNVFRPHRLCVLCGSTP